MLQFLSAILLSVSIDPRHPGCGIDCPQFRLLCESRTGFELRTQIKSPWVELRMNPAPKGWLAANRQRALDAVAESAEMMREQGLILVAVWTDDDSDGNVVVRLAFQPR